MTQANNGTEAKTRKSPTYKITPDQFTEQIKTMEPKDLFAMEKAIGVELERRRTAVAKLAEELKPQTTPR